MSGGESSEIWGPLFVIGASCVVAAGLAFVRWRELLGLRDGFTMAGSDDARIAGLGSAAGSVRGRPVHYRAEMGSRGSKGRTTARAPIAPGAVEVEMHLTPQTDRDARLVERGLAIDVVVGEPLFDAAFVVEAAPAETARALLDAPTRSTLRALLPCELHVADGEVVFRNFERRTEPVEVCEIVKLVGGLAARLATVGHELEERKMTALQEAGAGYRGVTAVEATAKLGDPDAAREIQMLHAVRARRAAGRLKLVAVLVLFTVGVVVAYAMSHMR